MDNDFVLPPDLSPEVSEAILKAKAAIEKPAHWPTGNRSPGRPLRLRNDCRKKSGRFLHRVRRALSAPCVAGLSRSKRISTKDSSSRSTAVPRLNGLFSTLSGIRKSGAPLPQERFPLADAEFPTCEAAVKAALEECMGKIDTGFAG